MFVFGHNSQKMRADATMSTANGLQDGHTLRHNSLPSKLVFIRDFEVIIHCSRVTSE
jgi:hypothetical protein